MKILRYVFIVVLFVGAEAIYAVEYFPSEPGLVFKYAGGDVAIESHEPGTFSRMFCVDCPAGSAATYTLSSGGDVYRVSFGSWASGGICPDVHYYEPDLLYLDFPLEPSKTWSSAAFQSGVYGENEGLVVLTGAVEGPKQVSVPAGEFEVYQVTLEYVNDDFPWWSRTETLWLHNQLGPVEGLVSWSGIVPQRKTAWGSLKVLYR